MHLSVFNVEPVGDVGVGRGAGAVPAETGVGDEDAHAVVEGEAQRRGGVHGVVRHKDAPGYADALERSRDADCPLVADKPRSLDDDGRVGGLYASRPGLHAQSTLF